MIEASELIGRLTALLIVVLVILSWVGLAGKDFHGLHNVWGVGICDMT